MGKWLFDRRARVSDNFSSRSIFWFNATRRTLVERRLNRYEPQLGTARFMEYVYGVLADIRRNLGRS